jgi:hypothetical protein
MSCDWYIETIYSAAGRARGWLHFGLVTSIMIGINKGILRLDFIKV